MSRSAWKRLRVRTKSGKLRCDRRADVAGGDERHHVVERAGQEGLAEEVGEARILEAGHHRRDAAGDVRLHVVEVAAEGGALDAERAGPGRERQRLRLVEPVCGQQRQYEGA
jgi:hypothetical protein